MDDLRFEAKYPPDSRFSEIEKIFSYIKLGKSIELIGLPGIGRSNLLGLLSFNRNVRIAHVGEDEQTKFHFVLINFSEMKGKSLTEVNKFLFLSLLESLKERNILEDTNHIDSIFKEHSSNDELVLFQGLKKTIDYLALEKDLSVVFLFDRFEDYLGSVTENFFINLRSITDRAKYKFCVVFSLKRPLEDILEPEIYSPFYEFFQNNAIYLPLIDKPGLEFRIEHLQENLGKDISKEIIDQTIKLTSGHGKLTRICLENYEDTNRDLEAFYLYKGPVNSMLFEIWKSFTPEEQSFLKTPARDIPSHLVNIKIWDNGLEQITIPLFKKYVENTKIDEEKIIYDNEKNEIKKGRVIVSNGLTKLEFNLLKFFLQNENQVVGRDGIISAVWGEQKSINGVTEQALDQLILRLRKKIEKNPNVPEYIQTIKGRGIKFGQ